MMRVLVLDIATNTGFCATEDGLVVYTGVIHFDARVPANAKGDYQRHPAIISEAFGELSRLAADFAPDFIVAEIPHLRGGSSYLTCALYGVAQLVSKEVDAGFYGVHTATWQSRVIPAPKGVKAAKHDTKKRSLAHARALGFDPKTDDEADAICIADYAHRELQFGGEKLPLRIDHHRSLAA